MPVKRDRQARKLTSVGRKKSTRKQVEQTPASMARRFGEPEGNPINAEAQFGKDGGNPRHNGAWKKEDTLRYKLQQVAKLDKNELSALLDDQEAGEYEKSVARILLDVAEPQAELTTEERWRILNGLTNQDSGMPRQQVEQTNIEAPIPLSPRELILEPTTSKTVPSIKRTKSSARKPKKFTAIKKPVKKTAAKKPSKRK